MSPADSQRLAWLRPLLFFTLSIGTTLYAGILNSGSYGVWRWVRNIPGLPRAAEHGLWIMPQVWWPGVAYAVCFLAILMCHEMGHYLTARRLGVRASLPYVIPWFPPLGSLGAVIAMPNQNLPARSLMRIAAYGPFAGFIVAVPVMFWGLWLSDVRPVPDDFEGLRMGTSLAFGAIQRLFHPVVPPGHDVFLHPVALAGWAGCLITGLNLLPFGQLDGGHIAYAMFGDRFNQYVRPVAAVSTVVLILVYPGFIIFAVLLWRLIRVNHPRTLVGPTAAGADRRIGRAALLLFIVTFTPRPVILDWREIARDLVAMVTG